MSQFPDGNALGRVFFEEGIRHLEDAGILHEAARYPAAIASAMKAAELTIKSVVILGGALGWWDKIFSTHSPLSAISDSRTFPYFQHHIVALGQKDKTLVAEIKKMEKLAPLSPSGPYSFDDQMNYVAASCEVSHVSRRLVLRQRGQNSSICWECKRTYSFSVPCSLT